MKISETKMSVGLYLHGDDLNPDDISIILGVSPSGAHRKGDKRNPPVSPTTGREYIPYKSGLWSLVLHRDDAEVTDVITELLTNLAKVELSLASLPGVQVAFFDVFIAGIMERYKKSKHRDNKDTFEFELEHHQLAVLARFGIPIRFTATMCLNQ